MKKILALAVLALCAMLAFPAPRAAAQGILSIVIGAFGAATPASGIAVGGTDGTNLQAWGAAADGAAAGRPIPVAGKGFNASTRMPRYCDKVAQVSTTIAAAASAVQIVALAAAQNIYVCGYQLGVSTAVAGTALTWVEGTGALCVTGQTTILSPLITTPTAAPTTPNVTFGPVGTAVPFTLTAGDALCLKQAVTTNATTVTGWIAYTQN